MSWSRRADVGWGRAVLLGTGVGLGLALGASCLSSSPSRVSASADSGGRWLLAALVPAIGWPGRLWWFDDARGVLGQLGVGEVVGWLSDVWILQTLLACHLANAWRLPHRRVVEVALCAGVALQLTTFVALITPAWVASVLAPGALIIAPPAEAFVLTTWGLLTLGALCLRVLASSRRAASSPSIPAPEDQSP
jgi:hypothetical protein